MCTFTCLLERQHTCLKHAILEQKHICSPQPYMNMLLRLRSPQVNAQPWSWNAVDRGLQLSLIRTSATCGPTPKTRLQPSRFVFLRASLLPVVEFAIDSIHIHDVAFLPLHGPSVTVRWPGESNTIRVAAHTVCICVVSVYAIWFVVWQWGCGETRERPVNRGAVCVWSE